MRPRRSAGARPAWSRLPGCLLALLPLISLGCGSDAPPAEPPPLEAPAYRDVAADAGLHPPGARYLERRMAHILDSTGSGVALADYDGDGLEDIYVAGGQVTDERDAGWPLRAGALYRNLGDGIFRDVAADVGADLRVWANGAYFVDYDNDGDRDLFVTAWGPDVLLRNDAGRFSDVSVAAGVAGVGDGWSTSAAFGDLDGDGWLDLYVARYCDYDPADPRLRSMSWVWKNLTVFPGPRGLRGQHDVLYRNNGDGTFRDVSQEAGLRDVPGLYGLGVVMADLDDDGDLDVYVANDSVANHLWRNDGAMRFSEVGVAAGVATNEDAKVQAGMGVDAGDFDGDGRLDLVVTNFSHDWNTLYRNRGGLTFIDATFEAGMQDSYLALVWGVKFLDHDNDGWLDLFVANGHIYPQVARHPELNTGYRQPNALYRNTRDGRFRNVSAEAGPGLAQIANTRGVAVADLDRDGRLELVLTQIDAPPSLLRGVGDEVSPWIAFELVGVRSNRDAVGARLELEAGGRRQVRELNPFGSYLSQSSYRVHFGLGGAAQATRLTLRWPSGARQTLEHLERNRIHPIREPDGP